MNEQHERREAAGGRPPHPADAGAPVQWDLVSRTLAGVSGRWVLPLLRSMSDGISRPAALLDAVRSGEEAPGHAPLSSKIMFETLARMVSGGLCTRREVQGWPPETHYELTGDGRDLLAAVSRLGMPWPPPGSLRPAQLPAAIGDFTGRRPQVAQLRSLLVAGAGPGEVPAVVVSGAGGIGKTALAVHAAHQVSAEFPGGQLYVDLLGASPRPAAPGEVLARLLRDLGISDDKVPDGDDERAVLYRTTLAGRRVLILLDNARDAAQVRPLLPGSSSCAVLVTTRNRAPDLAAARFLDLDALEDSEALALFAGIAGGQRAASEPGATAEILAACDGLPLAVRICAARLAARRSWPVATLAGRLRDERRRLNELQAGDLAVRASFQVSYDSLKGAGPARAFRLLGLWPGLRISLPAAAALLGEPDGDAARVLEALVDASLLESPAPDQYRFHDLLKVYALERAQSEETQGAREEALSRLLWWTLDTARAAADTVSPQRYQVPGGLRPAARPPLAFDGAEAALAWYDDERANLVAAVHAAAVAGLDEVASRLAPTLFPLFNRRGNWADCLATHRVAAASAARTGDRLVEAWALHGIGFALGRRPDPEAFGVLERALAIGRELGDPLGEAVAAMAIAGGHWRMHGPGEAAIGYLRHAVQLLEPMGDTSLRAGALNNLGEMYWELDDLDAAAACYRQALEIRETRPYAAGFALCNLGRVYMRQGRAGEAIACFEEALAKQRVSGALDGEALALQGLGAAQAETGLLAEARASLTEALRIFRLTEDHEQAAQTAALLASMRLSRRNEHGTVEDASPDARRRPGARTALPPAAAHWPSRAAGCAVSRPRPLPRRPERVLQRDGHAVRDRAVPCQPAAGFRADADLNCLRVTAVARTRGREQPRSWQRVTDGPEGAIPGSGPGTPPARPAARAQPPEALPPRLASDRQAGR